MYRETTCKALTKVQRKHITERQGKLISSGLSLSEQYEVLKAAPAGKCLQAEAMPMPFEDFPPHTPSFLHRVFRTQGARPALRGRALPQAVHRDLAKDTDLHLAPRGTGSKA